MKIAMVSEHASPLATIGGVDAGGQNVHVAALATALAERGNEVAVYTRADRPGLPAAVQMSPGVTVEHIVAGPASDVPKDELFPYMAEFADGLARRWQTDPPEIVHAHFWMSGFAAVRAVAACGRSGSPVLQTFHALGTVKRRWQKSADTSPPQRLGIERQLVGDVERIIATCHDEVRELSAMGADRRRIDVVPCGVDVELFEGEPVAVVESTRRARLLALGRLVPRKGVDDAIRALVLLPDTELLVVGGPNKENLGLDPEALRLHALAKDCGVQDRVVFAGQVPHERLPAIIRSCDVVVAVPWYEPFGIVPLEAMACGVPVVGSAVGGLLDTVVDGVTGLLVEPGNPVALAAALRPLLADQQRRVAMGAAGIHRVRTYYSWDQVARQTEDAYARAVAANRRRPTTAGALR